LRKSTGGPQVEGSRSDWTVEKRFERPTTGISEKDPSRADYALEAIERTTNPVIATEVSRYRFTLFNRVGNAIYSTSPHKFSNAINNVWMALARQTAQDATAPVEVPD
jgi:hypothetical protein